MGEKLSDENKLLFSISPEAAQGFKDDATASVRALFEMYNPEGLRSAVQAIAGVLSLDIARIAGAAFQPVPSKAKYRIFSVSSVATRTVETGYPPRASHVEVKHYAHMKATGSRESAEASELEYMREKWPQSEGWKHTLDLLEVTEDFAGGEMRRIVVSGCLELCNSSAEAARKTVPMVVDAPGSDMEM
jgi:hypothetical protein